MVIRRVEEAAVDALIGRAVALVGALDRELTVRQRIAGHLDAAEALAGALGEQEEVEVDLRAEHLVHAAHVAGTRAGVLVRVEVLAAHLQAAGRVHQPVAEATALAALADAASLLCLPGHEAFKSRTRRRTDVDHEFGSPLARRGPDLLAPGLSAASPGTPGESRSPRPAAAASSGSPGRSGNRAH